MSGNICRCAAYPNIVNAVQQARGLGSKPRIRDLPFTLEKLLDGVAT
jgi:CO/xanthine dehydrogenase Mo-binding subunit